MNQDKSNIIHYSECPLCGARDLVTILDTKDHTVSGRSFTILQCRACSLRITQDVPDAGTIGTYYQAADYISHSDTSEGLINQCYKRVRRLTLRQKRRHIQKATGLPAGTLLDVGSGTGSFVHEMSRAGWKVNGLEPDPGAREAAHRIFGQDLADLSEFYHFPDNSFDAITLWHVLEHVHELHPYMGNLKRILKKNGRIFIAVPNYTAYDARVYQSNWAAYDVPRHLYHFSPAAMERLVGMHGMRIEEYRRMWFDSFYISMLSSRYQHGRSRVPAAVWKGFLSNCHALANRKTCSSLTYVIRK